ncbi:DUF937 domain-containing protein [Flavobacterium psychrophilum]|uniref:DUF937 domain-containing protein n=1 Tax=Flavobacterium psychrophilum TaxID=96345 RepID=UPI0010699271|nr:DUF937 domain-containing protein [Flavobacterium psychrophilum]QRE62223.1 DUF937 domain-containing protein [Flavobacterium psychrophilum]QRE64411.1 DUF937 domain-containing protein [Flavobacterium psychrophilum]
MAGLIDLLNSDLGKQIISGVSAKVGTSEDETSSVLASALPSLVGGMINNAATPEGQSGLLSALLGGKHDGSILDNLSGFITGGDHSDGASILGHVLGNNQENVQNQVSQNTGVSHDKIAMIMKMAAPILMGYLAKQAQGNGLNNNGTTKNGGGITDMLGGLLNGGQLQQQAPAMGGSILTSILDQDGDGQLGLGDAVAAATKKGGLGGLLGNLFGK